MTKVTAEMLERLEGVAAAYSSYGEFPNDLRALTGLCRRVIEPGEDVVERCAREIDPEAFETVDDYHRRHLAELVELFADLDRRSATRRAHEQAIDNVRDREPRRLKAISKARAVLASLTQGEGD